MTTPHQNLVLQYNSNNQNKIDTFEEFDEMIVESPNEVRPKSLVELELQQEPNCLGKNIEKSVGNLGIKLLIGTHETKLSIGTHKIHIIVDN
jgi:hypothetical protein